MNPESFLSNFRGFVMSKKHFGIDHKLLGYLWASYKSEGTSGLTKKKNVKADYAFKVQVVRHIEENHLTMVSLMRIRRWDSDGSSVLLPEQKRKHSSALITLSQRQRTIMQSHDLT
jgi:hypothetical protein